MASETTSREYPYGTQGSQPVQDLVSYINRSEEHSQITVINNDSISRYVFVILYKYRYKSGKNVLKSNSKSYYEIIL